MTETETVTYPVAPEACEDHLKHYRRSSRAYDYDTGIYGDYTFTCLNCGHVWTKPGPTTQLRIEVEIKVAIQVDVLGFFRALSAKDQQRYAEVDLEQFGYDSEFERPIAYLMSESDPESGDIGGLSLLPARPMSPRGEIEYISESVEVDESNAYVNVRDNRQGYSQDWSMEDFEALREGVDWLDAHHRVLEGEEGDEEALERLARTPGPLDDPLFGED